MPEIEPRPPFLTQSEVALGQRAVERSSISRALEPFQIEGDRLKKRFLSLILPSQLPVGSGEVAQAFRAPGSPGEIELFEEDHLFPGAVIGVSVGKLPKTICDAPLNALLARLCAVEEGRCDPGEGDDHHEEERHPPRELERAILPSEEIAAVEVERREGEPEADQEFGHLGLVEVEPLHLGPRRRDEDGGEVERGCREPKPIQP